MNVEIDKDSYLNLEQVKDMTGVSEEHLSSFISSGDLQTIQIGNELYVTKVDFAVFEKSLEEGRAILYSATNKDHISLDEEPKMSQEEIDELKEL